jgi:hypothetical protein
MGMTPEQYFEAFVEPNQWDCNDMPGDIRRAFNAAVSAAHLADHYFNFHRKHQTGEVQSFSGMGEFVEYLSKQTGGAFRDVRSISNAYKHLYNTEGPSAKYESINSCGSVCYVEIGGDDNLEDLEEHWVTEGDNSRLAVVFTRKDGTKGEYLTALNVVISCLRELVYKNV